MKKSILFISTITLFGCTSGAVKVKPSADPVSTKKAMEHALKKDAQLRSRLQGVWTDGFSENATFEMKPDSIYYVEHFKSYKYDIENDMIAIHFPENTYIAKVSFLKDTLIMSSVNDGPAKFWKFKD